MNLHLIIGIASFVLSAVCGRWAWLALTYRARFPEGGRYWDWNLWAIYQCYAALIGGAYFMAKGLGHA